ncbi:MAG TPA: hypothetical protein VEA60_04125 [Allosphingosinicella sp.]|nr:hypothetical protein [Allosphingosinicella sp.]
MARKEKGTEPRSEVSMSAPWVIGGKNVARVVRGNVGIQRGRFLSGDELNDFVHARTDLHATYIQETQRTRRLGLYLAAGLLALACLIPVFAPEGRETLSTWIALALFVFAAGSMGYTSIKLASDKRRAEIAKDSSDA